MLFAWVPRLPGAGAPASAMSGRATSSRRHRTAQKALIVGQIALAFVVLVAAGLLLRSLVNIRRVDVGFDHAGVVSLKAPNYTRMPGPANRALFTDVAARLGGMPGVVDVAVATTAPFDASEVFSWRWRTDGGRSEEQASAIAFNTVGEDYFRLLGVPLLSGRAFGPGDIQGAAPVIVINARFAQMAFPDETAVGKRVQWSFDGQQWGAWRTVVGVVGDTRERGPARGVVPAVHEAVTQAGAGPALLIRTVGEPAAAARALAAGGMAIGAIAAMGLVRVLDRLLFAVEPADAATFAATAALVAVVAAAASWLPARRAPAVDPAILLRAD